MNIWRIHIYMVENTNSANQWALLLINLKKQTNEPSYKSSFELRTSLEGCISKGLSFDGKKTVGNADRICWAVPCKWDGIGEALRLQQIGQDFLRRHCILLGMSAPNLSLCLEKVAFILESLGPPMVDMGPHTLCSQKATMCCTAAHLASRYYRYH